MATSFAPPTQPPANREPATQPRLIDYLLLWIGIGLSALLAHLVGVRMRLPDTTPGPFMLAVGDALPTLLFLPLGVILLWPLFYTTQWVCGRKRGLTIGEWLLGLAWLAALAFAAWGVGKGTGRLPEKLSDDDFKRYAVLGYILFMLSMGALAAATWVVGVVARWQQPWTHTLSLALMIWPALPLLVVWLGNIKLE